MTTPQSWSLFGLTVLALFIKQLGVLLVLARERFGRGRGLDNPEDKAFIDRLGTASTKATGDRRDLVDRANRVLANDAENLPLFLATAIAYIQLEAWGPGLLIYLPLFVLARVIHAVSYLQARQPYRHLTYQAGLWITLIMLGHVTVKASEALGSF